ncbi:hypothetical protein, partial [Streptomyces anthocyanicus]|uniref:hypothetical protein n=1 Tax=Streptomyces anthocyanicus TaxID=68174 RepID=UPI001BC99515
MPQRQRFRPYGQPTLTLVEMRQQHLGLRRQNGLDPLRSPHARTTSPAAGSHDLFPGKPLEVLTEVVDHVTFGLGG